MRFMLANLLILHKKVPNFPKPRNISPHYYWTTCLRSIAFYDKSYLNLKELLTLHAEEDFEIYHSWEAYRILLQIVLGLDSHILGETEVNNQFKENFSDSQIDKSPAKKILQNLRNSLLYESKSIRSRYLQNIGSHSYAGIARQISKGSSKIYLIGTGNLAKQMIPFLQKKYSIHIVGRSLNNVSNYLENLDSSKASARKYKIPSFSTLEDFSCLEILKSSTIIIAASMPHFSPYLKNIPLDTRIIDYRADHKDSIMTFSKYDYYSLSQIYENRKQAESQKRDLFLKIQTLLQDKFSFYSSNLNLSSYPFLNVLEKDFDPVEYLVRPCLKI